MPGLTVHRSAFAGVTLLLVGSALMGQQQVQVVVTAVPNPVPAGSCSGIWVEVRDASNQRVANVDGIQLYSNSYDYSVPNAADFAWRNSDPASGYLCARPGADAVSTPVTATIRGTAHAGSTVLAIQPAAPTQVASASTPAGPTAPGAAATGYAQPAAGGAPAPGQPYVPPSATGSQPNPGAAPNTYSQPGAGAQPAQAGAATSPPGAGAAPGSAAAYAQPGAGGQPAQAGAAASPAGAGAAPGSAAGYAQPGAGGQPGPAATPTSPNAGAAPSASQQYAQPAAGAQPVPAGAQPPPQGYAPQPTGYQPPAPTVAQNPPAAGYQPAAPASPQPQPAYAPAAPVAPAPAKPEKGLGGFFKKIGKHIKDRAGEVTSATAQNLATSATSLVDTTLRTGSSLVSGTVAGASNAAQVTIGGAGKSLLPSALRMDGGSDNLSLALGSGRAVLRAMRFDPATGQLTPASLDLAKRVAAELRLKPAKWVIEAYVDAGPGDQELSEYRAGLVKATLIHYGVPGESLMGLGYGPSKLDPQTPADGGPPTAAHIDIARRE
jgi:outer membrane protein OmpA-like peptidoglycan-associated protein